MQNAPQFLPSANVDVQAPVNMQAGYDAFSKTMDLLSGKALNKAQQFSDYKSGLAGQQAGANANMQSPDMPVTEADQAYRQGFNQSRLELLQSQVRDNVNSTVNDLLQPGKFTTAAPAQFQARMQGVLSTLGTQVPPELQTQFKDIADQYTSSGLQTVSEHAITLAKNQMAVNGVDYIVKNMQDISTLYSQGKYAQAQQLQVANNQAIDSLGNTGAINARFSTVLKEQSLNQAQSSLYLGGMQNAVKEGNGAQYLTDFMNSTQDGLTAERKQTLVGQMMQAQKQWGQNIALSGYSVNQDMDNAQTAVKNGADMSSVLGTVSTVASYYPGKLPELQSKLNVAQYQSALTNGISGVSPTEATNALQLFKPAQTDPDYAEKMKVWQQMPQIYARQQKQLLNDPAAFFASNPNVLHAIQARNVSASTDSGDSFNTSSPASNDPIATLVNAQKFAGVPDDKLSVIPRMNAAAYVADLHRLPVDQQLNRLQSTLQSYGQYNQLAMRDLVKGGLPAGTQMLLGMQNNPAVSQYVPEISTALSSTKVPTNIDGKEKGIINTAVYKNMNDYLNSMSSYNGIKTDTINQITNSVGKYAQYLVSTQGMTGSDAAKTAVNRMVNSGFQYTSYSGNTLRIPNGIDALASVHAADYLYHSVQANPNLVIPSYAGTKENYLDHLTSTKVVTSPDNTGLMLLDSYGNPVMQNIEDQKGNVIGQQPVFESFKNINDPTSSFAIKESTSRPSYLNGLGRSTFDSTFGLLNREFRKFGDK